MLVDWQNAHDSRSFYSIEGMGRLPGGDRLVSGTWFRGADAKLQDRLATLLADQPGSASQGGAHRVG